jgi:transposase, IS30 family
MGEVRTGRPPLSEKRDLFARLIREGATIAGARRAAGVSVSTAHRWRHGRVVRAADGRRVHYPPVVIVGAGDGLGWEPCGGEHGRYLCECERAGIGDLRRARCGVREIGRRLGRPASTVSRELARNADRDGRYRPRAAHARAVARRARPRPGKVARDPVLAGFVAARLRQRWSPEQISQALRCQFPGDAGRHVVPETIYQAVYRGELAGQLPGRALRTGRARRRRRPQAGQRRHRIADMTPVSQRCSRAADRSEPGHWEGDLITGEANRSAIITVVDRATRFTLLGHLPGRHTAEAVRDQLITMLSQLPPRLRRSLTWDQGNEMSMHKDVTAALRMPVYFCDPHSPWQRPTNENTNGLLRQYFPKGTDLSVHTAAELAAVAAELNARPRKVLGWDTPAQQLGR